MAVLSVLPILLFALVLAGVLSAFGWRRRAGASSWGDVVLLATLFFLAIWAGRLWLLPAGPVIWGVAWLPALVLGLLFALVLAAFMPVQRRRPSSKTDVVIEQESTPIALSVLLWIVLVLLVAVIAAGYA